MSVFNGPSPSTNGLVFAYDMANTKKSYKGKPITNQYAVPTPDANGNVTFSVNGTGTFKRIYSGNYGGYEIQPTDIVYRYDLGGTGCHYHGNTAAITAGQYVTFTFDYYVSGDAANYPTTNYLANLENAAGGAVGTGIGVPNSNKEVWQTVTFGGQASANGTQSMYLYPGACSSSYLASSGYILYKNPQVIFSSTSNDLQAFTTGTRSTTQAILDLTGKNVITASSLTYSSAGTFSFNGTSDSITIPFNSSQFTFNSEQTIIMWMKNQSPSSARRNPYNQAYAGAGTITHENDTNLNYYYGTAGNNTSPYTSHTSPFNVVVNETAQIAITRNTSQTAWYKNGALGNTQANPYGASVATGTSDITIGNGYAGYFGGSLYIVQIYNRALTADEIAANYQAYRGRYGI